MRQTPAPGAVYGTPGGTLRGAPSFAANQDVARIGGAGERKTASILDAVAKKDGGFTVLHDLRIPGRKANIDHIIVSGKTVYILDTKVWAGGTYWTLGQTFKGTKPATKQQKDGTYKNFADTQTIPMALDQLLPVVQRGGGSLGRPLMVVWTLAQAQGKTDAKGVNVMFFRPAGGTKAVQGIRLLSHMPRPRPAHRPLVEALLPFVHGK